MVALLTPAPATSATDELAALAEQSGICRVHIIAWRDLADAEAGGSEKHSHEIASRWAAAGIDVTVRTSNAVGQRAHARRAGYSVIRRAGRFSVFPRTALSEAVGRTGPYDGLVEVWNGMPFFSPLWARGPRITVIHHVHAQMWRMVLPPHLARIGELIEGRLAPPLYRSTQIVTPSPSSRNEIVEMLGLPRENIAVVPNGVESSFVPAEQDRSPTPLIVSVGRLVPVKRLGELIDAVAPLRLQYPDLQVVLAGEGYEREALEEQIRRIGASDWIRLPGHVSAEELVRLYQQAWVVTSASLREGWGLSLTEAGACGTPVVATRIAGHVDAVADGVTGLLVPTPADLGPALDKLLASPSLRHQLGQAALARSRSLTWDAAAVQTFALLARQTGRRRSLPSAAR